MEVNELRIGNFVYCVFAEKQCIDIVSYLPSTEEISPIPLTEDWLIKFGFKEIENNNNSNWYFLLMEDTDNSECQLHINLTDSVWWIGVPYEGAGTSFKLKYIHQLQNMVFALTGEELKTKGSTN
jgi:hypothetical protein